MDSRKVVSISATLAFALSGCATKNLDDLNELPPTALGTSKEFVIDNSSSAFYTEGEWQTSTYVEGYEGENYAYSDPGTGSHVATWNLDIIKTFDVFAKWASYRGRGSNVKYIVHHLDENDRLVTDTIEVDQRSNGGKWNKLGTYRMSALTGRVTVSNDADGYVIADAILFVELEQTSTSINGTQDSDGDGIPDNWEVGYGLDPLDAADATLDADQDQLTNLDEYLLQTDPTLFDTDSDGMDDGFEVSFGLDPVQANADADLDSDQLTNYEEYLIGTDPSDNSSALPPNSALLTWEVPTERVDGTLLEVSEISHYEISYELVSNPNEIVIDNESPNFVAYGNETIISSYSPGYIGENYLAMPAGSGEMYAEWSAYDLSMSQDYELFANWASNSGRASNAVYAYQFTDAAGSLTTKKATVNQQVNGGSWQKLGSFSSYGSTITIRLDNDANGYVIADAVKLQTVSPEAKQASVEPGTTTHYLITDLLPGEWQFQIRVVDVSGLSSEFSAAIMKTVN